VIVTVSAIAYLFRNVKTLASGAVVWTPLLILFQKYECRSDRFQIVI